MTDSQNGVLESRLLHARGAMFGPQPRRRRERIVTTLVVGFAMAAVVALALEFGFHEPPLPLGILIGTQLAAVAVYVLSRVYLVYTAGDRWRALRSCWPDVVLLLGAGAFLFVEFERSTRPVLKVSALYVAAMQVLLVSRLAVAAVRLNLAISQSRLHPTRVLTLTFLTLIVVGGLALSLPKATHSHLHDRPDFSVPRHVLNSLFTATSATCVTGLVVYDTGSDLTLFGQAVVLGLIQAGGLGIMIFGSLVGLLVGRQLSLRQSLVLQDALSYRTLGLMRRTILFIVVLTFVSEAIGAAVLYPMWEGMASPTERMFYSVFHAVSAFCNAGFALRSDSLVAYSRAWQVYVCVVPLIILGGLGFPVLRDLWETSKAAVGGFLSRRRGISLGDPAAPRPRLTLHSKLVLVTTVALIVVATLGFFLCESFAARIMPAPSGEGTMANTSVFGRLLDGFFYAVTCRTAGFNTVGMGVADMSRASHFLGAVLMFIGG